jgi:hypothetical protein
VFSRLRIAFFSTLLIVLLGCASSPESKPHWVEAPDADIPVRGTFAWNDGSGKPPVTILDNRIRDAVRAALLEKGYVEASDNPGFLVSHETIEQAAVQQGNPVRIGIGVGSWGSHVGGSVGTSVDVGDKEKVVNQLVVQISAVNPEDGRQLWTGTSVPLAEKPDGAAVDSAVAAVMKGFPAAAAPAS